MVSDSEPQSSTRPRSASAGRQQQHQQPPARDPARDLNATTVGSSGRSGAGVPPIVPVSLAAVAGVPGTRDAQRDFGAQEAMPKWAEEMAKSIALMMERMRSVEQHLAEEGDEDDCEDEDEDSMAATQRMDDSATISTKDIMEPKATEMRLDQIVPILELKASPPVYCRRALSFIAGADIFTFRKPEGVRLDDGVRLLEIPAECRPVRSAIRSKWLKQAYDALFSVGLFVERYGSAIANGLSAGEDPRRTASFLLCDLVAPVSRIVANACHLISLAAGEQEDRDLASFGLVLNAPKDAVAVAPIALQLSDLKRQAAEQGIKDVSRKVVTGLKQQMQGAERRPGSAHHAAFTHRQWAPQQHQQQQRGLASAGPDGEALPRPRRFGRRKFVPGGLVAGVAGAGRQAPAGTRDPAAPADV